MNQNDLYTEYARVIKMCKGTALENTPWVCVKFEEDVLESFPYFACPPSSYQFAIAILENRPVFVGDEIYSKSGERFSWDKWETWQITDFNNTWTWQPPKPKRRIVLEETGDIRCVKKGEYAEDSNNAPASLPALFMWDCDFSSPSKYKIWRIVEDTRDKP